MSYSVGRSTPAAYTIAFAMPATTAFVLNAPGSLWYLLLLAAFLLNLFRVQTVPTEHDSHDERATPRAARARIALNILLPLFALLVVARIIIVPYSLYDAWFRLVEMGRSGGSVSNVFVWVAAYLGVLAGGSVYRYGVRPALLATALSALMLAGIATASGLFFLLSVPIAVATIAAYRRAANTVGARAERQSDEIHPVFGRMPTGKQRGIAPLATGIIACAIVFAIPALFIDGAAGNRYIDHRLSPALRQHLLTAFPSFPLDFGFGMYGYSLDSRNLGGRPALSHNPVFEVTAYPGQRIYLRSDVFDVYSGRSWERSDRMRETAASHTDNLQDTDAPENANVEITFLTELYESVPHTLSTRHVELPEGVDDTSISGHLDTGFRFSVPPEVGETIVLRREERPQNEHQRRYSGEYLSVPAELPQEVRQLARELRVSDNDSRATLRSISRYLAGDFEYTLEPEPNLREGDFVEEFLFHSREGYCVQFATSFVVLARLNGIPARYVTGFLVNMPYPEMEDYYGARERQIDHNEPVTTQVTGLRAHAWPEVWIPGRGWTIWEATPPMRVGEVSEWTGFRSADNELTNLQLEEIGGETPAGDDTLDDIAAEDESPAGDSGAMVLIRRIRLTGSGIAAIVAAALLTLVAVAGLRAYRTRRRLKNPVARFDRLTGRLIAAARTAGVAEPTVTGYRTWSQEIGRRLPRRSYCIRRATDIILRTLFASHVPSGSELRLLTLLDRALRRASLRPPWRRRTTTGITAAGALHTVNGHGTVRFNHEQEDHHRNGGPSAADPARGARIATRR